MSKYRAVLSSLRCCSLLTYRRYTPEVGDVIVGRVTEVRYTGLKQAAAVAAGAGVAAAGAGLTHNNSHADAATCAQTLPPLPLLHCRRSKASAGRST